MELYKNSNIQSVPYNFDASRKLFKWKKNRAQFK